MEVDTPKKDHVTLCQEIGVPESLVDDVGCNVSGLYDLVAGEKAFYKSYIYLTHC
jgi:hypothetical protein